jgi:hypothetical protein
VRITPDSNGVVAEHGQCTRGVGLHGLRHAGLVDGRLQVAGIRRSKFAGVHVEQQDVVGDAAARGVAAHEELAVHRVVVRNADAVARKARVLQREPCVVENIFGGALHLLAVAAVEDRMQLPLGIAFARVAEASAVGRGIAASQDRGQGGAQFFFERAQCAFGCG